MDKIYTYYRERIAKASDEARRLGREIYLLGSARLGLVALAILLVWLLRGAAMPWIVGSVGTCALVFAALMRRHFTLYRRKAERERLITLNERELKGLDYDFSAFDGAADKIDAAHPFSLDLDLFGDHSLFQSLNRTVTAAGRERLADWFLHPLTDAGAIRRRQAFVRELAERPDFRQKFYVDGVERPGSLSDVERLARLGEGRPAFRDRAWCRLAIWLVPAGWIALFATCGMGLVGDSVLGLYCLVALALGYGKSKALASLYARVNKMEEILKSYARLARLVEGETFRSEAGRTIREAFLANGLAASTEIRRLSALIGGLDQRFSLAGLVLNLFCLRDTRLAIQLERWMDANAHRLPRWIDALAEFDAYASLAGFAFNHPDYPDPTFSETYFEMEGRRLGHPLLDRAVCVRNDIRVPRAPWFLIITGANMAGKSTYLRTVGVNYLLACVGAPVCAESLRLYPAPLMTSLRTSDSLASHESYFFAELKRLSQIIERLRAGERLFIILDEILKGTNSVDKQKGSLALMRQLVGLGSCGIIATHDLLLGSLEEAFPEAIKNYRFEADIQDDELSFSYELREGVAQNMNACFLMRKMGITV